MPRLQVHCIIHIAITYFIMDINCSNLVYIFMRLVSNFSGCGTSQGILYEVVCCIKGTCVWFPSMSYEHCKFREVWLDTSFQAPQLSSVGVAPCPPTIFLGVMVRDSHSWCWSSGCSAMSCLFCIPAQYLDVSSRLLLYFSLLSGF
jgi:hypothetical protein